ncbi:MAG TPA: glycoside hydrolase family 31 protein [Polyangiaceae bacterium]|nr:glycoside hydrolase family 31 protein [Polyangiaceae bacterium]
MATRSINPKYHVGLGAVTALERSERGLLLHVGEEKFRVDVIRADLFRLKISRAGQFDEAPTYAAAFSMPAPVPFQVHEAGDVITLETSRLKLVIWRAAFGLAAYRTDGSAVFEDAAGLDGRSHGYVQLNDSFVLTRRIARHDAIYGLGEKTGRFNRRGRNFILWNTDVLHTGVLAQNRLDEAEMLPGSSTNFDPYYSSIPFFYHSRTSAHAAAMSGSFIDNGYKANFEFDDSETYRIEFHGGQYTEYVFAGPNMKDILEAYTFITGRISLPPIWALGHHQCRWYDYNEADIVRIGRQYRERNIPCDVLWLDIEYMDGYRVFTWNTEKFPDLPRLLGRLAEAKLRVITIVDPGVKFEPGYAVFDQGLSQNLFCKTEAGNVYVGQVWPGRTAFPDFSKPRARAWWGALNARHVASGIAGIWNDMNEPATGQVAPFQMRFDRDGENHPHERFHNQYGLLMAMATHEGLLAAQPSLRTFILSRAGFSGIQRYAAQWLGDNCAEWSHLALSIPMTAGMGVSGQAFIGGDIPGFMSSPSAELAARWTQYGALTPFCRYHSERSEPDKYPWSFGPGTEKLARTAIELRYRLLPYIYSAFVTASETGAPVQRPLLFDFQNDRQAWETDDAYLFGEALLVAPVTAPGCTARHVYLPPGSWVDFHTGERHAGGQVITAAAPADRIPLFERGGYVVPLHERAPLSTMGHYPELLELHVIVPDEDGDTESMLQEDDGTSRAYATGAFLRTTFTVSRRAERVTVRLRTSGSGFPEFRRRQLRFYLRGYSGDRVELNGQVVGLKDSRFSWENRGEAGEFSFSLPAPEGPLDSTRPG